MASSRNDRRKGAWPKRSRSQAVAVDTTEFFSDFKLVKSPWSRARLAALRGTARLWVPELVILETARYYEQQIGSHFTKLSDADQAIARLAWSTDELWAIDEDYYDAITRLKSGYVAWLRPARPWALRSSLCHP